MECTCQCNYWAAFTTFYILQNQGQMDSRCIPIWIDVLGGG